VTRQETGEPALATAVPTSTAINSKSLKGKFTFASPTAASAASSDTVQLTGTIKLPAGVDVTKAQSVFVGMGNIIDGVTVPAKGKPATSTGKLIKAIRLKLPKIKGASAGARSAEGTALTTGSESAVFQVTLNGPNFSANGFDTEGVEAKTLTGDNVKTGGNRSIQTAFMIAGMAFVTPASPTIFKLSTKKTSGTISFKQK